MKTYQFYILLCLFTWSCTDVIDVEVQNAAPRLVIEASIDWEKGTIGNEQLITLSQTVPYFDELTANEVVGASVKITNDTSGEEFVFTDQNDGTYTTDSFVPVFGNAYTLEVVYNGETYLAQETMISVVDIAEINQSVEDGFNDEALELNVLFNDPEDEENFYLFRFQEEGDLLPELLDISDEFTNGNQMTIFYEKEEDEDINQEEFESGDIVAIKFHGISERYYNYIRLLIEQYESVGDPFSTTPVPLKGNCTNPENPDNYAFGYFRLSETVTTSYTFE
jgi:effector-binding domain-containing protein